METRGTIQRKFGCISVIVLILLSGSPLISPVLAETNPSFGISGDQTLIATNAGRMHTEGDAIVRSNGIREVFGVRGKGVKVGVIGDGVSSLTDKNLTNNLGTVHILSPGVGDEGTAMLEIIHDLAPDAELYFCSYGGNSDNFKNAVSELAKVGCNVICDDLYFFRQPFFEDGDVANHIKKILAENPKLIYVTVSGNFAPLHYQQPWRGGISIGQNKTYQDFTGKGDYAVNMTIPPQNRVIATLQWDDPWNASGNDYDLVLTERGTGRILNASMNPQTGKENPFEHVVYSNDGQQPINAALSIIRNGQNMTQNTLELFIRDLDPSYVQQDFVKDPYDSIFGHAALDDVITVGSVDSKEPYTISPDSSRGPSTIIYPQPVKRLKPDLSAPTNVHVTGSEKFPSLFPGTSAAAPHVAAVVAQLWGAYPDISRDTLKKTLLESANDLGPAGWDETYGYGLVNAEHAYRMLYDKGASSGNLTNGP